MTRRLEELTKLRDKFKTEYDILEERLNFIIEDENNSEKCNIIDQQLDLSNQIKDINYAIKNEEFVEELNEII